MGLDPQTRRKVDIALRVLSHRYFPVKLTQDEVALLLAEADGPEASLPLEDFAAIFVRRCSQQMCEASSRYRPRLAG
jgi:hypothetical protein